MLPSFENKEKDLEVYYQHSEHVPPHLHDSLEILYVTRGTLTLASGMSPKLISSWNREAERGSQEAHLVDTHTSCSGEKGKPTCDATLSRSVLQLPEE